MSFAVAAIPRVVLVQVLVPHVDPRAVLTLPDPLPPDRAAVTGLTAPELSPHRSPCECSVFCSGVGPAQVHDPNTSAFAGAAERVTVAVAATTASPAQLKICVGVALQLATASATAASARAPARSRSVA